MISNVNKLIIWILLFSCCWGLLTPQFVLLPVILALFYMMKTILERQSGIFKKHLIAYFIFFHNQRILKLILRAAKPIQNIQLDCLPAIFHNSVLFCFPIRQILYKRHRKGNGDRLRYFLMLFYNPTDISR